MADDLTRLPQYALRAERWAYRLLLARQPGFRRRLDLRGPAWERLVDVFVFADATTAAAALAAPARQAFVAAHPAYRDTTLALLVDAGNKHTGIPATLLQPGRLTNPTDPVDGLRERLVHNG